MFLILSANMDLGLMRVPQAAKFLHNQHRRRQELPASATLWLPEV